MLITVKPETANDRLTRLLAFDNILQKQHPNTTLIGVDEVGRGSLIGPVVSASARWKKEWASVILNAAEGCPLVLTQGHWLQDIIGVNDSKKLPALKRQALLPAIHRCFDVAIGEASIDEIAAHNIIGASLLSSARAVRNLCGLKDEHPLSETVHLLMDGRDVMPAFDVAKQTAIIRGDGQSLLIAVASIVAKETRDAWVLSIADQYPDYGWSSNMGYATAKHRNAISQRGLTEYHRTSFKLKSM